MPAVRLKQAYYFKDIVSLSTELAAMRAEGKSSVITIQLYVEDTLATELTMEVADMYIVAFSGADRVYSAKEFGGENYNDLGMPAALTKDKLSELVKLGRFSKGVALNKSLIAIAAVVVSEASRFQAVHMYIQGLLSGTFSSVPLAELDTRYFKEWKKTSASIRAGNFVPGPQIVVSVLHQPKAK